MEEAFSVPGREKTKLRRLTVSLEAVLFLTLSLLSFPSLAALKTTFLNSMAVLEAPRAAECVPEPCLGGGVGADAAAAAASAVGISRSSSTLVLDELVNYDGPGIRFCYTGNSRTTNKRRLNGQEQFPVSTPASVRAGRRATCYGH